MGGGGWWCCLFLAGFVELVLPSSHRQEKGRDGGCNVLEVTPWGVFAPGLRRCCILSGVGERAAGHPVWGLGTARMCAESWVSAPGPWQSQMLPVGLVCVGRLAVLVK